MTAIDPGLEPIFRNNLIQNHSATDLDGEPIPPTAFELQQPRRHPPANDPLFILPLTPSATPTLAGDLRLQTGSPAIEAGDKDLYPDDLSTLDPVDPTGAAGGRAGSTSTWAPTRAVIHQRSSITVTTAAESGPGSLRDAIAELDADGTIIFDSSLAGRRIMLTSGELVIDKPLTIDASALSPGFTIDAGGWASRALRVDNGDGTLAAVTLKNIALTGGVDDQGGGLLNREALTLVNCRISGNQSPAAPAAASTTARWAS